MALRPAGGSDAREAGTLSNALHAKPSGARGRFAGKTRAFLGSRFLTGKYRSAASLSVYTPADAGIRVRAVGIRAAR